MRSSYFDSECLGRTRNHSLEQTSMTKEENLALVDPVKANDEEKPKPAKPNNEKPQEEELVGLTLL